MTCENCQRLEGELELLKARLEAVRALEIGYALRQRLSVSGNEAIILLALYTARGLTVSSKELASRRPISSRVFVTKPEDYQGALRVIVYNLRVKLGSNAIHSVPKEGYRLTPAGIALIDDVLKDLVV